jgi:hypothetical protein
VLYNITLLANRVLEICPLAGQPLPCRVRFRLGPGQAGTVQLVLTDVSSAGAAWKGDMRPLVQQWAMRYLGVSLAEGGPGEGKT